MKKTVQNIPFLRFTIALAIGIIVASIVTFNYFALIAFLIVFFIASIAINIYFKYSYNLIFGISINLLHIFIGIYIFTDFNKKPQFHQKGEFFATVLETPQKKPNSYQTIINATAIRRNDSIFKTNEKIITYFNQDSNILTLSAGDIIIFKQSPQIIENRGNPYEFDYKKFLGRKKIYRQVYLSGENWAKANNKTNQNLAIKAERTRENLLDIYRNQPIDQTELEILSALTLGYKRELDPETKRVFSAAGATHILAVSGLHVGVIYMLISFMLGFLKKQKTGRMVFVLLTCLALWIYAFITGLSPSVLRATLMFTIFLVGENINRKSNTYNSLAASAFLLLLINPNNLFDVGFQLSYSAVFGIVYLQPKLEKIIPVKNKILEYAWVLLTVSIAAQFATFPLTSYYFNQFPTYFWISNLIIIPSIMILITAGITLLFVSNISILSLIISTLLNYSIKGIYFLLSTINKLPYSIINISTNPLQLILLFGFLVSIFVFANNFQIRNLKIALSFILISSLSALHTKISQISKNEIIVYNSPNNLTLQLIRNKTNYIISEKKDSTKTQLQYLFLKPNIKLNLNPPVFLTFNDSLIDQNLFLKNGVLYFEGHTIILKSNEITLSNQSPQPFTTKSLETTEIESIKSKNTITISNKMNFEQKEKNPPSFHYLQNKGSFRKKW